MNIHEYQAKQLFKNYNVKTLEGVVATNASEAANACKTLGGNIWVVKAQVHAGGTVSYTHLTLPTKRIV